MPKLTAPLIRLVALAVLNSTLLMACSGKPAEPTGGGDTPPTKPAVGGNQPASMDVTPSVRTTSTPDDPCGWIPAEEVESVVGKFAAPPRKGDGCIYTLEIPEAVIAKRQKVAEMQKKIQQAFGTGTEPPAELQVANGGRDPNFYGMALSVDVQGGIEVEVAEGVMAKRFAAEFGDPGGVKPPQAAKAATDWDHVGFVAYGFSGRIGHLRITVMGQAPDVPQEPMLALAERVRDRIPDLPFPVTNPYQVIQLGPGKDPCGLLTRAEAEAVLGPLVVEPYRSSSNWPPLAHGKGSSCAYYTRGHHVFVLSPTWQGGAESWKVEKGVGGLIGMIAPQEMTVMKGPWDQASISGATGALLFLKGDQLLEVHYRTSRATRGEAVKLAAIAVPRLGS